MTLAGWLEKRWYQPAGRSMWSLSLLALSWVYGLAIWTRKKLYAIGVLRSTTLSVPVIVVGNVVVGGVGKTPIVIEIARLLRRNGLACGVVSRGYGRRDRTVIEVGSATPVSNSGDEPALISAAQIGPVFVGASRADAAVALLRAYPHTQVILSDDGLQHLALQRQIEICVFDERCTGNGCLLPAGPLREPWPRPVDFLLHRSGMSGGYEVRRSLRPFARSANGAWIALADLVGQPLIAVAAIGRPDVFFAMLEEAGLSLAQTIAPPDHDDLSGLLEPLDPHQAVVCTEKDAVKLWAMPLARERCVLAVPLEVDLPQEFGEALLKRLSCIMESMAKPN